MENIGGIFVVLICGLIIAVFVAVMEFIWSTRRSAESEEVRRLRKGVRGEVGPWGWRGVVKTVALGAIPGGTRGRGGSQGGRDALAGVPELQKEVRAGTSLVVQCLGLVFSRQRVPVQPLVRELRSHKLQCSQFKKKKKRGEGRRKTRERVQGHEEE